MLVSRSGEHKCGFTKAYKHLGTIKAGSENYVMTAKARANLASARYIQLAYHVFANIRIK